MYKSGVDVLQLWIGIIKDALCNFNHRYSVTGWNLFDNASVVRKWKSSPMAAKQSFQMTFFSAIWPPPQKKKNRPLDPPVKTIVNFAKLLPFLKTG